MKGMNKDMSIKIGKVRGMGQEKEGKRNLWYKRMREVEMVKMVMFLIGMVIQINGERYEEVRDEM